MRKAFLTKAKKYSEKNSDKWNYFPRSKKLKSGQKETLYTGTVEKSRDCEQKGQGKELSDELQWNKSKQNARKQ